MTAPVLPRRVKATLSRADTLLYQTWSREEEVVNTSRPEGILPHLATSVTPSLKCTKLVEQSSMEKS